MATISTTGTSSTPLESPSKCSIARQSIVTIPGQAYAVFARTAATTYTVFVADSTAASWTVLATFTRSNLIEWSSIVLDKSNYLHIAYRVSDTSVDRIYYRRLNMTTAVWSAELQVSGNGTDGQPNGGTPGGFWQGVDIAVVQHANSSYAIAVAACATYTTVQYGLWVHGVSIDNTGRIYLNNPIINGQRSWFVQGTAPGRQAPTCELEHNGDGYTASNPALWVSWGRTTLYSVKLSWLGSTRGWNGPSTFQSIASIAATENIPAHWDGTQYLMATITSGSTSTITVYQRNQANNATNPLVSPVHPQGVIRGLSMSYDASRRDIRIYAVGTSTAVLYYVDYVRATTTWGTWTTVSADALNAVDEFSTKRGGSAMNARHDVVWNTSASSPYTLKHLAQAVVYNPSSPTWDTSVTPYDNGGAADVAASLLLDWTFQDIDPNDSQSAYALRRTVGVNSPQYWRASDSTWQASEVINTSSTTSLTLASGWGADSDGEHQYFVKTRDQTALDSGYSAALVIIPAAKNNPTITSPTLGQVIGNSSVSVTWTVAQQTQVRVQLQLTADNVIYYDSGWRVTASTSFTPPYTLPDDTTWNVIVTTKNTEGLSSSAISQTFSVDYVPPTVPQLTVTPNNALARISVAISNPSPTGTQPTFASQNLYRRPAITPNLITNSAFNGNTSGFSATNSGVLTYSTAQFAPNSGPGSARLVPSGAAGSTGVHCDLANAVPVDPTKVYQVTGWIRPDTVTKTVALRLVMWDASNNPLGPDGTQINLPAAGVWYFLVATFNFALYPTAAKAGPGIALLSTPAAGDAFYTDQLELRLLDPTVGDLVATGLGPNVTAVDWRAPGRVALEYRAVALGSNNTSQASPWTT